MINNMNRRRVEEQKVEMEGETKKMAGEVESAGEMETERAAAESAATVSEDNVMMLDQYCCVIYDFCSWQWYGEEKAGIVFRLSTS